MKKTVLFLAMFVLCGSLFAQYSPGSDSHRRASGFCVAGDFRCRQGRGHGMVGAGPQLLEACQGLAFQLSAGRQFQL